MQKKSVKNTKKVKKPKRVETSASVRIDAVLNSQLEYWLDTDEAKGLGFHSKSDFMNESVRDMIQRVRGPRFADLMLNDKKDYVMVDARLPPPNDYVTVLVDPKHKTLVCNLCKSEQCDHVMFIWRSPSQKVALTQQQFLCKIKFGRFYLDV